MKTGFHKKLTGILICTLVLGLLLGASMIGVFGNGSVACAESGCGGSYTNGFCSADGAHYQAAAYNEEKGRYEIANAGQLYWFADKVATDNATYGAATVVLTADITVNSGAVTSRDDSLRQWTPIGTSQEMIYSGHFDGQGHTVSGLYYYSNDLIGDYVGLFGWIQNATVENVNVVNFYFQANRACIGGVVARMYDSTVQNCYTGGKIYAKDAFSIAGGIVASSGVHGNLISGCLANVSIQTTTDESEFTITPAAGTKHIFVGAIVGTGQGTVQNCIYITDTFTGNIEDDGYTVTNSQGLALSAMTDGAAAYILGAAWGQNIDNGQPTQALPVLGGAVVYYGYSDCDADDLRYSNTKLNPTKGHKHGIFAQDHELIAACVYCGANEQGRLTLVAPADLIFSEGVTKSATYTCNLPDCSVTHAIEYCCVGGCMTPGTHTASVTVDGATAVLEFEIMSNLTFPSDVTVEITTDPQYLYYRGASGVKPEVSVKKGGVELTKDTDFSVYYSNNINVTAEAQLTVVLHITGYEGASKTVNFEIVPFELTYVLSSTTSFDVVYGTPMWGTLPTTFSPMTSGMFYFDHTYNLVEGVDYVVKMTEAEYKALDVGSYHLVIEGIGNFSGIKDAWIEVDILPADLTTEGRFEITVEDDLFIYNGVNNPVNPNVTVYDTVRGEYLTLGYNEDFYFSKNQYLPGPHSISLMGTGNYTGVLNDVGTFEIRKATAKPEVQVDTLTLDYDPAVDFQDQIKSALSPTLTLAGSETFFGTLSYEYRAVGDTEFTSGLPPYAGAYEIRVVIDEYSAPDTNLYDLVASDIATVTINKLKVTVTVLDQYLTGSDSANTYPSLGTTYTIEFANFADQITTVIQLALSEDGHEIAVSSLTLVLKDGELTNITNNCDVTVNTGNAHRVSESWTAGVDAHSRTCTVGGCGYVQEEAHHSHVLTQDDTALTVSGVCGICSADCGTITLVLPQNAVYNGKPHLATLTGEIRGLDMNDTAYVELRQASDNINSRPNVDVMLYVYSRNTDGDQTGSARLSGRFAIAGAPASVRLDNVSIEQSMPLPTEFSFTSEGILEGHTVTVEGRLYLNDSNTPGEYLIQLYSVSILDADGNSMYGNYDLDSFDSTLTITDHTNHRDFDANGICGICGTAYETPPTDADGTYLLSKLGHLYWLAAEMSNNTDINAKLVKDINLNEGYTFSLDADGNLVVMQGESVVTDLSVLRVWTPIMNYNGIFDGQEYTISGLYVNDETQDMVGLFGSMQGGTVKNIIVANSFLRGYCYVGGVVGWMNDAHVQNCKNHSVVSGQGNEVGGVVGGMYGGTLENCFNSAEGTVKGNSGQTGGVVGRLENGTKITGCYNLGTVIGIDQVGGVVGTVINATVQNFYNAGTVYGYGEMAGGVVGCSLNSTVEGCYNTGSVSGVNNVGGLVASSNHIVKNCYNAGNVSGSYSVGGIVGFIQTPDLISYCLNVGNVTGNEQVGGIVGFFEGTIELCFYLSGTATGGICGEDADGKAEAVTVEQLASGEVTYLLNSAQSTTPAWGQTLGTDTQPKLGGDAVYTYYDCDGTTVLYSNTENTPNNEHADKDQDHDCDGCGTTMGTHEAGQDTHICDYCNQAATTCNDADKDHDCDVCGVTVDTHEAAEGKHTCDWCGLTVTQCKDNDKDHDCDVCGETVGDHEAPEGSHLCNYCRENVSECTDANPKDHACDICDTPMGYHEEGEGTHVCEYCGEIAGGCDDTNPRDHACDVCGMTMGDAHEPIAGTHYCGYCNLKASECVDGSPSDHKCDVCGETTSECKDDTRDHLCDICGEKLSEHTPANNGDWIVTNTCHWKQCEYCLAFLEDEEAHYDDDSDHKCDVCLYTLSYCADADTDHDCDVCGAEMGTHEAAEGKHTCNYCGEIATDCTDEDSDHLCDVCGVTVSDHSWTDATCTAPKTCTVCGATEGELGTHTPGEWVIDTPAAPGVAGQKHKACTACGEVLSTEAIDALPSDPGNTPPEPTAPPADGSTGTESTPADRETPSESGCKSSLRSGSAIVLISLLAVGVVLLRKKRTAKNEIK